MYDTLIAQQLSDGHLPPQCASNGDGGLKNSNPSETVRWSPVPVTPGNSETPNSNCNSSSKESAMSSPESSSTSPANSLQLPNRNLCPSPESLNNSLPKGGVGSKNSANQATAQQHHLYGVLSRSFSRWSSRITDKSSKESKGSPAKGNKSKGQAQIQRPLSVNSTLSSTSSSSCSSESSASLGRAPKASPEEEDVDPIPDADLSDEDGGVKSGPLPEQISNPSCATDRCFSNTTTKENGENGGRTRVSYPVPVQGRPKFYDPNLSYMDRVVMEIVETERVYVTDLREIISGYLDHWRIEAEEDGEDGARPLADINELFSNIEEIHKFNSEFVTQLEVCGLDPVKVAKCFVTKNEGFSVYTQYCTHYPRTMSILTEMMRQDQSAKSFRERQAFLGHTLPLGSYLLKPVQRILKYHLLLQNIVKHYDRGEEGYESIVEALSAMTNIAHHINDMKRRHEHAVRVQEIQSLLYGWQGEDLTTYGELCAEGTFRVYGAKALRHVFLFDKMLLITKKKEDGILSYKSHIMCSNLMLIESVPGEPLSFHVIPFDNPRLQCTLQAKNLDQKREWTLQLKRVILENYHAVIPIHARQLVMELGQCRSQDERVLPEKVQTKRQHSAPEYLERRKHEKDRRKAESTLKARLRKVRKTDPISPKESLSEGRRTSRRTSMDSTLSSRDRSQDSCEGEIGIGIDRKMSSASCPPSGNSEKRLVKKLSGWRRKSEPGLNLNGHKGPKNNGLSSQLQSSSEFPIDSTESIDEGGEESVQSIESSTLDLCQEEEEDEIPTIDQRRESVEEIVGQLVMQNREFQRILSKQRLVHLRRALAQHQQRQLHEEDSETETEDLPPTKPPLSIISTSRNGKLIESKNKIMNGSQGSSSNGIGSSSDMNENSREDDELLLSSNLSKNVQRTVSDPGNKSTLTQRRFISHYDPLSLLWSSFRRGQGKESGNAKGPIRHTHSFTCSKGRSPEETKESQTLPHGDSGVFPGSFTSDSSSSSEANIPTLPAVWLKQQGEHLASPNTKSGSLPRSFQVGSHSQAPLLLPTPQVESGSGSPGVKSRLRDGKYPVPDRPFTIASDKPSPSDMTLEEMEGYMSKFNEELGRAKGSDDLNTPLASMESLHPDHKIYRSSKSSIKHILLSVTHRLSGFKANRMTGSGNGDSLQNASCGTLNFGSYPNINAGDPSQSDVNIKGKPGPTNRPCKKSLKEKIKENIAREDCRDSDSENCESVTSSGFGSLGSCGSSTKDLASKKIGARLAQASEHSDYALSKLLGSALNERLMNQRTTSVMSVSSTVTSCGSADEKLCLDEPNEKSTNGFRLRGNRRNGLNHRDLYLSYIDQDNEDGALSDSDGSADSFYERSFEAIESLLESEMFPDSAIYSDVDESSTSQSSNSPGPVASWRSGLCAGDAEEEACLLSNKRLELNLRLPLHVPQQAYSESRKRSLVCSQAILEKLKHLEECAQFQKDDLSSPSFEGIKSIQERRKELDLWRSGGGCGREDESETSSQHSTSTINTVIEVSPSKTTSYPSSRRCSDTESSGGNSPLTERAVSRSSARSHSQGHLSTIVDPTPKGWVKLVVGKLQGEGES